MGKFFNRIFGKKGVNPTFKGECEKLFAPNNYRVVVDMNFLKKIAEHFYTLGQNNDEPLFDKEKEELRWKAQYFDDINRYLAENHIPDGDEKGMYTLRHRLLLLDKKFRNASIIESTVADERASDEQSKPTVDFEEASDEQSTGKAVKDILSNEEVEAVVRHLFKYELTHPKMKEVYGCDWVEMDEDDEGNNVVRFVKKDSDYPFPEVPLNQFKTILKEIGVKPYEWMIADKK